MQSDACKRRQEAWMPAINHPSTVPDAFAQTDRMAEAGAEALTQPSLDRFAGELSAMIEVAAATAETMNQRLREASDGETRAGAMSTQLQEQLRLGARMLSAFQTQVARVESTLARQHAYEKQVAETQAKIEQCFAGIESCVDTTIEQVARRLAEQARIAMQRFDEGLAARQEQLGQFDARIAECAAGINGICAMVEKVQASVGASVVSNEQTLEQIAAMLAEGRGLLSQHASARETLTADLLALRETLALGQRTDAALCERLHQATCTQSESERLAATISELHALLARLQPWEALLLCGSRNGDGLPQPVADVAGEVRRRISQDMNWLNLTMRDVSARVAQLAAVAPVATAEHSPVATDPVPAIARQGELGPVKKPLRLHIEASG
jgi:hypothetical protein